ncbi:MAG TPA: hypothetical protein VMW40_02525 [Candidatus Bathyarchaeia archaeon]|nr:hypothetical protein [Candidatus Bathyarchaeia archaeon]
MKRKSSFGWLHVILVLVLLHGFIIGACAGQEEQQQVQQQEQPVITLTDLDFNNDGYINQIDLDVLKSHFNERYYSWYVPWDLNADFRCDYKDFYYFADHVPLDYRYQVAVNISAWNLSNYTIDGGKEPALILDEIVYPQNTNRTVTWVEHYTSLESPKNDDAVCVHYTRDLCRLAYKNLGPKTIAWGSSGVHAYGMIYTGGDWRDLSNWFIIDPYWKLYDENILASMGFHDTHTIKILLDEGRYGYWAIHLSVDYQNNTVHDPYKAEYRIGEFREPQ